MATSRSRISKHPQARKFKPPLKATPIEPSRDRRHRSPQNKHFSPSPVPVDPYRDDSLVQDCETESMGPQISTSSLETLSNDSHDLCDGGTSLPGTQTHTVLSYCDNYQPQTDDKYITSDPHSPRSNVDISSSEESDEPQEDLLKRFQVHKPENNPQRRFYDYRILPDRKRSVADVERKTAAGKRGGKRVRIMTPLVTKERRMEKRQRHLNGPGYEKDMCEGGLSVYDYQPTPQESEEQTVDMEKRRKRSTMRMNDGYTGSAEEQLAIDRQVIEIIRRTRLEIRTIRNKYTSRSIKQSSSSHSSLSHALHLNKQTQYRAVTKQPLPLRFDLTHMVGSLSQSEE